jgi:epoxyqueuosine reductase
MAPRDAILAKAREIGFDQVGITTPDAIPHAAGRLDEFIALGRHGDMAWMEEKADRRRDPRVLWPEVKSIIMLGLNYGPEDDPLSILDHKDRAGISVYARGKDYHDIVKKRLKRLARWIVEEFGADVKVFVDTAPVMEKPLAGAAGLGWQGKHTNLVSREKGSWLFLGSVFTTLELEPDQPEGDHCGQCHRCLDICPTQAFPAPYQLDARRCITYRTIELKGQIPAEFRKPMANRIYGCDDCLAICPWNKFADATSEVAFHARDDLTAPKLTELATLDDAAFRTFFSGSPVKRIGRDRFIRNVLIALGNCGDPSVLPTIEALMDDASPLVRAMAAWAYRQLATPAQVDVMTSRRLAVEEDEAVRGEWTAP